MNEYIYDYGDYVEIVELGKLVWKIGDGNGFYSCGWIFYCDDCFDYW